MPPRRRSLGPRVGTTQRVKAGTTALSVTVKALIDPLRDSGAALVPGTRAVGVVLQIVNDGPAVYDSSATGDVSIVPSSGLATPVFVRQGICQTPLRDFDNYIEPGVTREGCVAFSLDSQATVRAVRFSPHGQMAGSVTWTAGRQR